MRDKIVKKLQEKKGMSAFVEIAVLILVVLMLLSLSISFLQIYARHNLVNTMAHEMARYIEIKGTINSDTYSEFARLKAASGFKTASVSFDRSGTLQLETPFTVTVTVIEKFGIGTIKVLPVSIKAVSTGRSEVYWK